MRELNQRSGGGGRVGPEGGLGRGHERAETERQRKDMQEGTRGQTKVQGMRERESRRLREERENQRQANGRRKRKTEILSRHRKWEKPGRKCGGRESRGAFPPPSVLGLRCWAWGGDEAQGGVGRPGAGDRGSPRQACGASDRGLSPAP